MRGEKMGFFFSLTKAEFSRSQQQSPTKGHLPDSKVRGMYSGVSFPVLEQMHPFPSDLAQLCSLVSYPMKILTSELPWFRDLQFFAAIQTHMVQACLAAG